MTTAHPAGERTVSERLSAALDTWNEWGGADLGEAVQTALPAIELLEDQNAGWKRQWEVIRSAEAENLKEWIAYAKRLEEENRRLKAAVEVAKRAVYFVPMGQPEYGELMAVLEPFFEQDRQRVSAKAAENRARALSGLSGEGEDGR